MAALLDEIGRYELDILEHVKRDPDLDYTLHENESHLTAQCLEFLQLRLIHLANTGQFASPTLRRFMHPDFRWIDGHTGEAQSHGEFFGALEEMAKISVGRYQIDVDPSSTCTRVSGNWGKGKGPPARATTWSTWKIFGTSNYEPIAGTGRHMIGKLRWEKTREFGWILMRMSILTGFEAVA